MNDKTVILEYDQWMECWREMCKKLGCVPAWDQYSDYFGCISCNSTHYAGIKIVFEEATDAMAFKLKYS